MRTVITPEVATESLNKQSGLIDCVVSDELTYADINTDPEHSLMFTAVEVRGALYLPELKAKQLLLIDFTAETLSLPSARVQTVLVLGTGSIGTLDLRDVSFEHTDVSFGATTPRPRLIQVGDRAAAEYWRLREPHIPIEF